jgi:hypothetical protein
MPLPWLRLLYAVIGVTDLMRSRRIRALSRAASGEEDADDTRDGRHGPRPAFDRQAALLDLERQRLDAERVRAERAIALELLRQAGDREIGRLRLLAGVAVVSWLGTLFLFARTIGEPGHAGGGIAARMALGAGWMLLLAAVALSFAGQAYVARGLQRAADRPASAPDAVSSGQAGAIALWLLVAGLALASLAVLMA